MVTASSTKEPKRGEGEEQVAKKPKLEDDANIKVDEDKEDDEDEDEIMKTFKGPFPPHNKHFILMRVAADDVLQKVLESEVDLEGCLLVDEQKKSANFYAKFPENKGLVAGRIDNIVPGPNSKSRMLDERVPPTFFTALLSKALIDYGTWFGSVHRDQDTPGVNFKGRGFTMGRQVAKVGLEDVTPQNPFVVNGIFSVLVAKGETEKNCGFTQ